MPFATAKDLRIKTRAILELVRRGERIVITHRGRPVAVVSPAAAEPEVWDDLRPFDEAWQDLVRTLRRSRPRFAGPEGALKVSRRRT